MVAAALPAVDERLQRLLLLLKEHVIESFLLCLHKQCYNYNPSDTMTTDRLTDKRQAAGRRTVAKTTARAVTMTTTRVTRG